MKKPHYQPLDGKAYKMQMGLKPLNLKAWLEFGEQKQEQLKTKKKILSENKDLCLIVRDGMKGAIAEFKKELLVNLKTYHSDLFHIKDKEVSVKNTNEKISFLSDDPKDILSKASQILPEDLCFLKGDSPTLEAGLVCFPSRWNLKEKMGKDMFAIHQPVPKFNATIGEAAAKFLAMLPEEKPVWRLNWTLHDSSQLFCPYPDKRHKDLTKENVLEETFLRIERQTLRRLKKSNAICFTIRTYIHPMKDIIKDKTSAIKAYKTLISLPETSRRYKGMDSFFTPLTAALSSIIN